MTMARTHAFAAAVGVVVWACGLPMSDDDGTDVGPFSGPGLTLSDGASIHYLGGFSWDGATRTEDGYEFDNPLGYRFRVTQLRIATFSAQLRPCPATTGRRWRWGQSSAYADHVVEDDPSIALVVASEDALNPTWRQLGVGRAAAAHYCDGFVLSTPLTSADGQPEQPTLEVTGWYLAPDGDDWVSLDTSIPLGEGALIELQASGSECDAPPPLDQPLPDESRPDVQIAITRYPVTAFASVRPDQTSGAQFAWELLGGLLHTSTMSYHHPGSAWCSR